LFVVTLNTWKNKIQIKYEYTRKYIVNERTYIFLRERDHWGDPGVGARIIFRWIFRKCDVEVWTGLSWLRIRTGGGNL
jgi:hypothetical protein